MEEETTFAGRTIRCIAWDLIGKYSELVDNTHVIVLAGGRTKYIFAAVSRNQTVRLARLETDPLRQINRHVPWDRPVILVPIEKTRLSQE